MAFANPAGSEPTCLMAEQIDNLLYAHRPRMTFSTDYRVNSGASSSGPTPMEVGAITDSRTYAQVASSPPRFPHLSNDEREKLRKSGGCFYCRGPNHMLSQCPKRREAIKQGKLPANRK